MGTGDFNGDGKTDILWRHAASGQNVVWFLNGTSLISGTFTNPIAVADMNWRTVGDGDYNVDGRWTSCGGTRSGARSWSGS